jgi:hypothetical protein
MKEKGLIMQIVLVIIALVLIKYVFHWSVIDWVRSPEGKAAFQHVRDIFKTALDYLRSRT